MISKNPRILMLLHLAVYGLVLAFVAPASGMWPLVLMGPLVWASWVDVQKLEIPDASSALLFCSGLLWLTTQTKYVILHHLLGAALWPLLFWAISWIYLKLRGRLGLGFGDVKLMAGIGLWCGLTDTILVVLGAALSGVCVLLLQAMATKTTDISNSKLAFGPYLCLFAWGVWLAGMYP